MERITRKTSCNTFLTWKRKQRANEALLKI